MNNEKLKISSPLSKERLTDKNRSTKAITLRLEKTWINKIDKLAYRLSNYYRRPVTRQFLIREIINAQLIQHPFSDLFKGLEIKTEREELAHCKRIAKLKEKICPPNV